jgi:hypothetical protein
MKNFLGKADKALWIAIFAVTPIFFLGIISQNSIPGDLLYPLKRIFENVALAAYSVRPVARAGFETQLVNNRFREAEKLLLVRKDTQGLDSFISQIEATKETINSLQDEQQKQILNKQLAEAINNYQQRLQELQSRIATNKTQYSPQPTQGLLQYSPSHAPVQQIRQTSELTPSNTQSSVDTQQPTYTPGLTQNPEISEKIDDTNKKLEELKKWLIEKRIKMQRDGREDMQKEDTQQENRIKNESDDKNWPRDHKSKTKE